MSEIFIHYFLTRNIFPGYIESILLDIVARKRYSDLSELNFNYIFRMRHKNFHFTCITYTSHSLLLRNN